MKIIMFDTETTGLLLPEGAPLENQPQIIEFAAIAMDQHFKEIDRLEFMCNPEKPLPPIITKITGITDNDLMTKLPFKHFADDVLKFWQGVDYVIAHNVNYDMGMLNNELKRLGLEESLPKPKQCICTVQETYHIHNRRLKLSQAYKHFTGKEPEIAHRAMGDVETLKELVIQLIQKDILCLSTSNAEQNIASSDALDQ